MRIIRKYPGCYSEIVADCLDEATAFQKEIDLIASFRTQGFVLANHTNGGEGTGKKAQSDEAFRQKMSELVKGEKNPNYNNHWSEEQKKHLSDLRKKNG